MKILLKILSRPFFFKYVIIAMEIFMLIWIYLMLFNDNFRDPPAIIRYLFAIALFILTIAGVKRFYKTAVVMLKDSKVYIKNSWSWKAFNKDEIKVIKKKEWLVTIRIRDLNDYYIFDFNEDDHSIIEILSEK